MAVQNSKKKKNHKKQKQKLDNICFLFFVF